MLVGGEHVDREPVGGLERGAATGRLGGRPQHQRRVEGDRGERVRGHAERPAGGVGGGDDGDAGGVLAQGPAQVAGVEPRRLARTAGAPGTPRPSSASNHHGANSRASSKPAATCSATAGCRAAASTTARWCGGGRLQPGVGPLGGPLRPAAPEVVEGALHPAGVERARVRGDRLEVERRRLGRVVRALAGQRVVEHHDVGHPEHGRARRAGCRPDAVRRA